MKTCIGCGLDRPAEEYPPFKGIPNNHPRCRPCKQQYDRDYYATKKLTYLPTKTAFAKDRQQRNREYVWKYLEEHPCVVCGEPDIIVLEFNHKDRSTKTYEICKMVNSTCSIENIKREIEKCEVMCANCHRRHTAVQMGWAVVSA